MIRPALAPRDDMVDFKVLGREVCAASGAIAALITVEPLPVRRRVVGRNLAEVRAPGNVRAVYDVPPQPLTFLDALQDQFRCFRRDVDSRPLSIQLITCHQSGRASAEWVQDGIAGTA